VILKIVSKSGYECNWKNSTNEGKGKPEQNLDAAFGTIFEISKFFHRSKKKLHINFVLEVERLQI
jgi:hypothetical protein